MNSLFGVSGNRISLFQFSGLPVSSNQDATFRPKTADSIWNPLQSSYSAAPASGFTFAADAMKSEMRGTISDLKREPLKTP
jgi:hypothetical protein